MIVLQEMNLLKILGKNRPISLESFSEYLFKESFRKEELVNRII